MCCNPCRSLVDGDVVFGAKHAPYTWQAYPAPRAYPSSAPSSWQRDVPPDRVSPHTALRLYGVTEMLSLRDNAEWGIAWLKGLSAWRPPPAFCLLPTAYCLLLPAFRLPPSVCRIVLLYVHKQCADAADVVEPCCDLLSKLYFCTLMNNTMLAKICKLDVYDAF